MCCVCVVYVDMELLCMCCVCRHGHCCVCVVYVVCILSLVSDDLRQMNAGDEYGLDTEEQFNVQRLALVLCITRQSLYYINLYFVKHVTVE